MKKTVKKTVTEEVKQCDLCNSKKHVHYGCIACGKDLCRECNHSKTVGYPTIAHSSAVNDVFYCLPCHGKFLESRDPLLMALRKLREICDEDAARHKDLMERREKPQNEASKLYDAARKALRKKEEELP